MLILRYFVTWQAPTIALALKTRLYSSSSRMPQYPETLSRWLCAAGDGSDNEGAAAPGKKRRAPEEQEGMRQHHTCHACGLTDKIWTFSVGGDV